MQNRTLTAISIVSTIVSFVFITLYVAEKLESRRGEWVEDCGRVLYKEPAQNYIDGITSRNFNLFTAHEDLHYLQVFYDYLAIVYEMYMADCKGEPDACYNFYEHIDRFYYSVREEIPEATLEYAIKLLKKGAEYEPDENAWMCYFGAKTCCFILSELYSRGDRVERDSVLARYYEDRGSQYSEMEKEERLR